MFPVRSLARVLVLLIGSVLASMSLLGQVAPPPESPVAIKAAIAQHMSDIAAADSAKDIGSAIHLRMALAGLSKPKDAQELYETVVRLADSTGRMEAEFIARRALANTLAARGQMKQAYEEALRIADRSAEWSALRADSSDARAADILRAATLERDSLMDVGLVARKEAEQRVQEADERGELWMGLALLLLVFGVVGIVLIMWMNGKALRRHRDELASVRADVQTLTERLQNRLRDGVPTMPEKPAVIEPVVVPPVLQPTLEEVDPVVMGMFRKQAPERLVTLREARIRNDHEKVQRVVHSLKPQLASLDPASAELCTRIIAPGAAEHAQQWNADLDALEIGVARFLR